MTDQGDPKEKKLPWAPSGGDPWEMTLEQLSDEIHKTKTLASGGESRMDTAGGRHDRAEWLTQILQARAVLEAAQTNRRLVWATWALVLVTGTLAAAAIWGG